MIYSLSFTAWNGCPFHLYHAARAHQTAASRAVSRCGAVSSGNIWRSWWGSYFFHLLMVVKEQSWCPWPSLSVGLAPGTVVITDKAVDYSFRPQFEQVVLGKVITRSTELDEGISSELLQGSSELNIFPTVIGNTMCTHDFYEGTTVTSVPHFSWEPVLRLQMLDLCRPRPTRWSSLFLLSRRKAGVSKEGVRGRSEEHRNGVHSVCCHVPSLRPQR